MQVDSSAIGARAHYAPPPQRMGPLRPVPSSKVAAGEETAAFSVEGLLSQWNDVISALNKVSVAAAERAGADEDPVQMSLASREGRWSGGAVSSGSVPGRSSGGEGSAWDTGGGGASAQGSLGFGTAGSSRRGASAVEAQLLAAPRVEWLAGRLDAEIDRGILFETFVAWRSHRLCCRWEAEKVAIAEALESERGAVHKAVLEVRDAQRVARRARGEGALPSCWRAPPSYAVEACHEAWRSAREARGVEFAGLSRDQRAAEARAVQAEALLAAREEELADVRAEVASEVEAKEAARVEAEAAQEEVARLLSAEAAMLDKTTAAEASEREAAASAEAAQAELQEARRKLSEARSEVEETRGELKEVQGSLEGARKELGSAQSALAESKEEVRKAKAEAKVAQCELWDARVPGGGSRAKGRSATVTAAEVETAALREELDKVRKEVTVACAALCRAECGIRDRELALAHLRHVLERCREPLAPTKPGTPSQGGGPSPKLGGSFAPPNFGETAEWLSSSLPSLPGLVASSPEDVAARAAREAAMADRRARRSRWAPQWT